MSKIRNRADQSGFTLIELLIVVAIIGILAAIAVPQYQTYTKKAKFSEAVNATAAFKTQVEACYNENNNFSSCDNGSGGVSAQLSPFGNVVSVSVTDGVITATGSSTIDDKTYVLTPVSTDGGLQWSKSGTCMGAGYC